MEHHWSSFSVCVFTFVLSYILEGYEELLSISTVASHWHCVVRALAGGVEHTSTSILVCLDQTSHLALVIDPVDGGHYIHRGGGGQR